MSVVISIDMCVGMRIGIEAFSYVRIVALSPPPSL